MGDERCPQHPNEALPCRDCALASGDVRAFYTQGGEFFADAGDSIWSTCLCSFTDGLRVLDPVCPVHNDSINVDEFASRTRHG